MPTYEYRCDACGHEFELFQQMSAPVQRKCPSCSKLKLQRLIGTGAGILFKGGGFYETDYRSENYKKAAEADKKAAEPAAAEASTPAAATKSDAAPAAPSAPAPKVEAKKPSRAKSSSKKAK